MGRFANKIVVITGGTSGIGLAAARQFITEGATVVVIGCSPRSVGDAQKEIGANGVAIADVTKSTELVGRFHGSNRMPTKIGSQMLLRHMG
jgi:NAD(P)-dependent dehydrogenase (short-subunit alcohol dehydrogenase family)